METHDVMNRTHLIQAAATSRCNSSTIKMKRPDYEEKVFIRSSTVPLIAMNDILV